LTDTTDKRMLVFVRLSLRWSLTLTQLSLHNQFGTIESVELQRAGKTAS